VVSFLSNGDKHATLY